MTHPDAWQDIPGWTCPQQLALYDEVTAAQPGEGRVRGFVELGVAYGKSLAYLLTRLPGPAYVYGVDTWAEHMGGDNLDPAVFDRVRSYGDPQECARVMIRGALPPLSWRLECLRLCKGDSVERAGYFRDGELDFVFIDAEHTYDAVRRDIAAWLPKVRPGGVLAGHDVNAHFPGVAHAVVEALGPDTELRTNADGWGGVWIHRVPEVKA